MRENSSSWAPILRSLSRGRIGVICKHMSCLRGKVQMTPKWIDSALAGREERLAHFECSCRAIGSRIDGETMRNLVATALLATLMSGGVCFAQTKEPPDPYESIIDRMQSLSTV